MNGSWFLQEKNFGDIDSGEASESRDNEEQLQGLLGPTTNNRNRKGWKIITFVVVPVLLMVSSNLILFSLLKAAQNQSQRSMVSPGHCQAAPEGM
jgi:hypothetical protein